MTVTKDTLIGEILQENAEAAAPYFFEIGFYRRDYRGSLPRA